MWQVGVLVLWMRDEMCTFGPARAFTAWARRAGDVRFFERQRSLCVSVCVCVCVLRLW